MSMAKNSDKEVVQKMARLLKSGATMLDKLCPMCGIPLFRLKSGEIICPKCGQKFIFVETDEEELEVRGNLTIQDLEKSVLAKLDYLRRKLDTSSSLEEISDVSDAIYRLLKIIEVSRNVRKIENKSREKKG